jgi:hypothetical protein
MQQRKLEIGAEAVWQAPELFTKKVLSVFIKSFP